MTEIEKPELSPATKKERFAELVAVVTSAAPWIGGPAATNLKIKRVTEFVEGVLEYVEARFIQSLLRNS